MNPVSYFSDMRYDTRDLVLESGVQSLSVHGRTDATMVISASSPHVWLHIALCFRQPRRIRKIEEVWEFGQMRRHRDGRGAVRAAECRATTAA
jgi:hypothetical protein